MTFDWVTFRGTQSSWKKFAYKERPQDQPYAQGAKVPQSACGFAARLTALLKGEVEAASLLPPQIALAEQLGLRQIIANTFHTIWWVPEQTSPQAVTGYLAFDAAS